MRRILEEPLLHFLLLGALIFAAYGLLNRGSGNDDAVEIVITQGQLAAVLEGFARTRQRAPTDEEWQGLIRDRVQDEVLYREALALGLDKDDIIIRRRLRQKLQFVSEGLVAPAPPSDAQLQAYLNDHAALFVAETRFSFRQVYLDPRRRGAKLSRDLDRLRVALDQAPAPAALDSLGDRLPLDHEFENASAREVAKLFGQQFVAALGTLSPGAWQGPVESGYGVHLVFITARSEGGPPALDDVRDAVRREWADAQQREAGERFYQALLRKYRVTIEPLPGATISSEQVPRR